LERGSSLGEGAPLGNRLTGWPEIDRVNFFWVLDELKMPQLPNF
jgi:hypothetical protein